MSENESTKINPKKELMIEVRCSNCNKLKAKAMLTIGSSIEVYCRRCKRYTTVAK